MTPEEQQWINTLVEQIDNGRLKCRPNAGTNGYTGTFKVDDRVWKVSASFQAATLYVDDQAVLQLSSTVPSDLQEIDRIRIAAVEKHEAWKIVMLEELKSALKPKPVIQDPIDHIDAERG